MSGDPSKYLNWLERMLAEHVAKEDLGPGDLRRRLSATMTAARTLKAQRGDLFGLVLEGLAPEIVTRLSEQYGQLFEDAVGGWRDWLEGEHGDEGREAFRKIGENCGYFDVELVPLRRCPEVDAALAHLVSVLDDVERATAAARARGEAEDDQSVGYFLAPPTTDAEVIADLREFLPTQIEGLFAALDTLDIFVTEGAGGRSSRVYSDYVLIQPLDTMEDIPSKKLGDLWTLHVHDMGRFLCFNKKGELWSWDGFRPEPVLVAPDVATYLRQLADLYA